MRVVAASPTLLGGLLTLINSTVSGNLADTGGGISNDGDAQADQQHDLR